MAHLPPVTWHDVATKDDLRVLGADLRAEMRSGLAELRSEIDRAVTRQTWRLMTFIGAWSALLVTVTGLIR